MPLTREGLETIKVLKLDYGEDSNERPFLKEERLKLLSELRRCRELVEKAKEYIDDVQMQRMAAEDRDYLVKAKLPESAFSSMAQDFLEGWEP